MWNDLWKLVILPQLWQIIFLITVAFGAYVAPRILLETQPHPWLQQQNRILARLKFKSYEEFLDLFLRQNLIFCSLVTLSFGPVFSLYVRKSDTLVLFATVPLVAAFGIYVMSLRRKVSKNLATLYVVIHFLGMLVFLFAIKFADGNILAGFAWGLLYWLLIYMGGFVYEYFYPWAIRFRP